ALGQRDARAQKRRELAREDGDFLRLDALEIFAEVDLALQKALIGGARRRGRSGAVLAGALLAHLGQKNAVLAQKSAQRFRALGVAHTARLLSARVETFVSEDRHVIRSSSPS